MINQATRHINEIEYAKPGVTSQRDAIKPESRQCCISEHGLDPSPADVAYNLSHAMLRAYREQSGQLIVIARSGVEPLFRQVAGQDHVLFLTEAKRVAADNFGGPAIERSCAAQVYILGTKGPRLVSAPAASAPVFNPARRQGRRQFGRESERPPTRCPSDDTTRRPSAAFSA